MGDLNCHNSRWLRYSSCVSVEGRALHRFSMESGLHQFVKKPTRGDYLLDLVLSDLGDVVSTRVLPPVADHNLVFVRFGFTIQLPSSSMSSVWCYHSADWSGLIEWLSTVDFSFIDTMSVNDATEKFTDILLNAARTFISQRSISNGSTNHPWLNERCHSALLRKHAAFGTDDYKQACQDCSCVLHQEFQGLR